MAAGMEGAGRERSLGVNIRLPHEQGANPFIAQDPKLVEMRYFFTRKLMLIKESDGYAVLPGGFGTLDEAFELLTLLQTGKAQPAPLVLLDVPDGTYWHGWQRLRRGGGRVAAGLVSPEDRALYRWPPPTSTRRPTSSSASTATTTRAAGWATCWCCACRWRPAGPSWRDLNRRFGDIVVGGVDPPDQAPRPRALERRPARAPPRRVALRPRPLRPAPPAHRRPERVHRRLSGARR